MAKPQAEERFTQIPNEELEKLMKMHLSPNQWQVLLCIFRKTYGFHKKVDYIANKQIGEATDLGKVAVSRCLKELMGRQLITRNGKYIGFQKDWERWGKLSESATSAESTTGSELAESATLLDGKSCRNRQPKLAVSSTKLPKSAIKVSSSEDTQKKKETITKDTIQKKEGKTSPERKKLEFEDYIEELRPQFSDLDYNMELRKFNLYWSEGSRKLKRPKLALLNWMTKAREYKKEKEAGHGTHRGHTTKLPPRDKYTKPCPNPKLDKLVEQQRAADHSPGRDKPG